MMRASRSSKRIWKGRGGTVPDDATLIEFLDDDLREEFDKYKSGPGSSVMRDLILAKQRKRLSRSVMTPVQRRRDMARDALQADMLKDAERYHIHSVLAMCGLLTAVLTMGRSSISSAMAATASWSPPVACRILRAGKWCAPACLTARRPGL